VATIEAQTMGANEAASAFYAKLGFTEIDHGVVFRKDSAASNGAAFTSASGN
jgi:RimJ/RimL family protein N-acetyltransferase